MTFLFLVIALLTFGLVMLYSASNVFALQNKGSSGYYALRQLVFALIGITLMIVISCIDYRVLKRFAWLGYFAGMGLLVIVLLTPKIEGVHRWINLGFTTFQPSELMKFFIILLFSMLIANYNERMRTFLYGVLPFDILLVPVVALLVLEPHLSATIIFVMLTAVLLWVGGTHVGWFIGVAVAVVGALAAVVLSGTTQYWLDRLSYWQDPWSDYLGKGFQTIQSLYAIGSGGLWGVGLGNSIQKHLYLPAPQNDFIFAIVYEELGLIGALCVVGLFVALVVRGFMIAYRCRDKFGSVLAIGLSVQVGLQALLNIGFVTNTLPNTGISLPFFSYGGTSLVMLLAQMGVVLSISRSTTLDNAV
ncbi:MAG: putative lipid II flippase FtsW [Clostridia bacterium]|nr:putative lipid II flippase FtsW [Clostridia bacterium]